MTYEIEFKEKALKEFDKLSPDIATQFLKKLEKIVENPHIPKNKLHGSANKIYTKSNCVPRVSAYCMK